MGAWNAERVEEEEQGTGKTCINFWQSKNWTQSLLSAQTLQVKVPAQPWKPKKSAADPKIFRWIHKEVLKFLQAAKHEEKQEAPQVLSAKNFWQPEYKKSFIFWGLVGRWATTREFLISFKSNKGLGF